MEKYKKIASVEFVKLLGKEYILKNSQNIISTITDFKNTVEIGFYRSSTLQSEEDIIKYDGSNYYPECCVIFEVNKKDLQCKIIRNNWYNEDDE